VRSSLETLSVEVIEARTETARIIEKSRRDEWVARLARRGEVIGPVAGPGGDELFRPLTSPEELLWEFKNPLYPPKQFLLPQVDPIVAIRRSGDGIQLEPIADDRPRILLNIRSCDAKGFAFLRRVHAANPPDEAYLRRAANTTVITLACSTPCPLGFCICCDAGPFLDEGFDIQLTDLGTSLLAEPGSDRGRTLLAEEASLFRPARPEEIRQRFELEREATRRFGPETCHFASAMRRVSTGRVAEALWDKMSDWCVECGGCNFICPTCYCFSVKDRRENGGWLRCRTWDSCQYAAFTLEASGHNPRAAHGERVKRRFFHKVSAQHYVQDGMVGCVGCGRCVKVCMGTTDMPAVVAAIRRGTWNG
jgi:formate hydrogenlyase subunit 6/NADH:ubiquinone oxidoreductase subunit I